LVHSRFGLHVVEVLEREPGVAQPFEPARSAVALSLRQQAYVTAAGGPPGRRDQQLGMEGGTPSRREALCGAVWQTVLGWISVHSGS
jgi:hypothetical protein